MIEASAWSGEVRNRCGSSPSQTSTALTSPSGLSATPQTTAETLCGIATGRSTSVRQKPISGTAAFIRSASARAMPICSGLTISE